MSQRLGTIASCNGLITRLACARARSCGIDLSPILRRTGLTLREINHEDIPLSVTTQISCLNLIAAAVDDKLLGFHIARTIEPGTVGLLHYIVASADTLGDALLKLSRYSKITNEGIALKAEVGKKLRIGFDYAGVSRLSDRHQIEPVLNLHFEDRAVSDRVISRQTIKNGPMKLSNPGGALQIDVRFTPESGHSQRGCCLPAFFIIV
jgi:hypothetical protein